MVIIKNVFTTPSIVPNNGKFSIQVSCTVFTTNHLAKISTVWIDLTHTSLDCRVYFTPSRIDTIKQSREGVYKAKFKIPSFFDTGTYTANICAKDSRNDNGKTKCHFNVFYLAKRGLENHSKIFFLRGLEHLAKSKFVAAHHLEVLSNGKKALQKRLEILDSADVQINLQSYTLGHKGAANAIIEILLDKMEKGVEINIILNADSQLPTSPFSVLRLKVNQLLSEWNSSSTKVFESKNASGLKQLSPHIQSGKINLLLFTGSPLSQSIHAQEDVSDKIDHWLTKIIDGGLPNISDFSDTSDWLSSFQGPGGLPALPLLDYAAHEKIMVVDGQHAIVGGRNIEEQYFSNWEDIELYLSGPIVNQIQQGFYSTFASVVKQNDKMRLPKKVFRHFKKQKSKKVQFIQSRPWEKQYSTLLALVFAIQYATNEILIISQYIILSNCLLQEALLKAASRGVSISILTNSYQTSEQVNFGFGYLCTMNFILPLIEAGIKIFTYVPKQNQKGEMPYLHTKEFIFDDVLIGIGSFNLSVRSSYIESENIVFVQDNELIEEQKKILYRKIRDESIQLTIDDIKNFKKENKGKVDMARYLELLL